MKACLGTWCALVFLSACGDGDLSVYNNASDDAEAGADLGLGDASAEDDESFDMGGPDPMLPSDAGSDPEPEPGDMGSGMPDLPALDMAMPEPMVPTTNAPQSGPTVNQQITTQCSTAAVKGLSLQLIEQMNCLDPGIMKSFEGAPRISYSAAVFPFQQGPATDALISAVNSRSGTLTVNSALRTIAQQLLLYEWYNRGLCNANLAASPGRSNHNGGLAIDINDSGSWRTAMRNRSYIDNVSGEPWHFYYSGAGGKDVRNLSVLAFQMLYNLNFPENPITEDGLYGPQTEGALKSSPANGFTREPMCQASTQMVAYPNGAPLDLVWERVAEGVVQLRTIAPTGIRLVEYVVDGVLVGYSDQTGPTQFETVVELPRTETDDAAIEVRAFDAWGRLRGHAVGSIDTWSDEPAVFVRPIGGENVEIGVEELPSEVHHVEIYVDGVLLDPHDDGLRASARLAGEHAVDVVLYDERERVLSLFERTVSLPSSTQ